MKMGFRQTPSTERRTFFYFKSDLLSQGFLNKIFKFSENSAIAEGYYNPFLKKGERELPRKKNRLLKEFS